MVVNSASKSLLILRLYRSLLKAARPFDGSSRSGSRPSATALTCLIHRSGMEDEKWEEFLRDRTLDVPDDLADDPTPKDHHLFRKLLREFVSGESTSGIRQMQFPSHVQHQSGRRLADMIRREFKCPEKIGDDDGDDDDDSTTEDAGDDKQPLSRSFSLATRRDVAFLALRELNKKLSWADRLVALKPHPHQAARFVTPLPLHPSDYMQPGTYLISHPHMTDYFRRTVVCLLDHQPDVSTGASPASGYGTYGLIVNRVCLSPRSGRNLTLQEIIRPLSSDLATVFGSSVVREGGPVHMALQMLHSPSVALSEYEDFNPVGGTILPMASCAATDDESTALHWDRGVYFKGDVVEAANAVMSGRLDREDVSFFVGASCWTPGQLESEIERGFWLPCRGPPEIALTGICDHEPTEKGKPRPKADLWLSMLSACGDSEAELAHLMWSDDGEDECGDPCDDFS